MMAPVNLQMIVMKLALVIASASAFVEDDAKFLTMENTDLCGAPLLLKTIKVPSKSFCNIQCEASSDCTHYSLNISDQQTCYLYKGLDRTNFATRAGSLTYLRLNPPATLSSVFLQPMPTELPQMNNMALYATSVANISANLIIPNVRNLAACYDVCFMNNVGVCFVFTYVAAEKKCIVPDVKISSAVRNLVQASYTGAITYVAKPAAGISVDSAVFTSTDNVLVYDAQAESAISREIGVVPSVELCRALCDFFTSNACQTFSYIPSSSFCVIADCEFYDDWTTAVSSTGAKAYWKRFTSKYKLLTKHLQYKNVLPHLSYSTTGSIVTSATRLDMSYNGSYTSNIYLKNALIDVWTLFSNKNRVRFEFYNNAGALLSWHEYNAAGTTSTSWFDRSTIAASSYSNLVNPDTYNIWAMVDGGCRMFHTSHNFGGCSVDAGWSQISASIGCGCNEWDKPSAVPMFLYSPASTHVTWSSGRAWADVLIIRMSFN